MVLVMDMLPLATLRGPMMAGLGGRSLKLFPSLLGTGPLDVRTLRKGAQQTSEEAAAWEKVASILRSFERDILRTVAPMPFSGVAMRFEAFTGEAALQLLPEGHFSICHIVDEGIEAQDRGAGKMAGKGRRGGMLQHRGKQAIVYEGALERGCGESNCWGFPAREVLEEEEVSEEQELNVMAKACFTLWRDIDAFGNGMWRLQNVEQGDFSLIISYTPSCNPEVAIVRPGPGGSSPVIGAHWDRELKLRRDRQVDPKKGRKVHMLPKLMQTTFAPKEKFPLRMSHAGNPQPKQDWKLFPVINKSKSAPTLPGVVHRGVSESSAAYGDTMMKQPGQVMKSQSQATDASPGVSFRWVGGEASKRTLSFGSTRPLGGALGATSVAVLASANDATMKEPTEASSQRLMAMERMQRRQACVAALSPERRHELLFGPQISYGAGKAFRPRGPLKSRIRDLEMHIMNNDDQMHALRPNQNR